MGGNLERLRGFLAEHADDPSSLGLLGVVHVLERRPEAALPLLDHALAAGHDQDLALHRVRALIHLGHDREAEDALDAMGNDESLGRRLLVALVQARRTPAAEAVDCVRRAEGEAHLNGLFSLSLPAIVGGEALAKACESNHLLVTLLEEILDRMAGNLGLAPTFKDTTPTGEHRFVPVVLAPTTRQLSVAALLSLPWAGTDAVLAELESIVRGHPRSVQARCYRGELYLWLGRYDDAWSEFESARSIDPTRWAEIGMVAVLALTGRHDAASALALATETRFPPIRGGTLPVYRGLLRRRLGQLDLAIADLRLALAVKPSRIGARIELCLALRAAGRSDEATEHLAEVLGSATPLLVEVAEASGRAWRDDPTQLLGDGVLEAALVAMRGNRSSSLVTWVDGAGVLRALEPVAGLQARAQGTLAQLEERLGRDVLATA